MIRQVRNRLIKRLFFVALLLSVLSGTVVFFLEIEEVGENVLQLALQEAQSLSDHVAFLSLKDQRDFEMVRKQVAEHIMSDHISRGHFVVIELYDPGKKKVLEVSDPDYEQVEAAVNKQPHDKLLTDKVDYRKLRIDGLLYVQVFAPISLASGEVAAYFEGVYRVDPEAMRSINQRLLVSVLQVVVVIFVTAAAMYPVIIVLNRDMIRLSDDLAMANMGILEALGSAVSKRDRGTNSHNYRVTLYAIRLAEAVGLDREGIQGLVKGAFLHDIGKIGVSDDILHKPAGLTPEESRVMEEHVDHGVDIVKNYAWLTDAFDVVKYHHEKYDGTGYRTGLRGRDIPLKARIFAIVDVFDALTSKRPYRDPASYHEALHMMQEERGTRFDPDLLDKFMTIAADLHRDICLAGDERLVGMLAELRAVYFGAGRDVIA
ncbi:MAG: HD domain-containing phosphohydrolase [Nitrospirota bacterium]